MERHSFNLRVKSLTEAGSFSGMGAIFGNVDLGNDKILPGAFSRTLAGAKRLPLLWQHNPSDPIGSVTCTETSQGLEVQGQLLLSDQTGAKAYNLLKNGVLKGLSIGFETIQESLEDGVRLLKELRLWEVSIVTFPMNESAMVTGIKAMSDSDKARHLKNIAVHFKAMSQHQQAVRLSLKALLGGDFDDADPEDDPPADDPSLLEADVDDDDPENEGMSMVLAELKSMVLEAELLAPDL